MTVSGMVYFSFDARGPQTRCDGKPEGPSCNDRGRSDERSGWLVTRRCPSGGHALLGVSDRRFGGLRDYIWKSTHVRTLSDYPRQPPCDLCERRAHHAISPPTTSLLRQAIDRRPFTPLLNHCCAISAASSTDPCCSPSFESSIPGLHFNFSLLALPAPHGCNPK